MYFAPLKKAVDYQRLFADTFSIFFNIFVHMYILLYLRTVRMYVYTYTEDLKVIAMTCRSCTHIHNAVSNLYVTLIVKSMLNRKLLSA